MPEIIGDASIFENPFDAAARAYQETPPAGGAGAAIGAAFGETSVLGALERATGRGAYAGASWIDRTLALMARQEGRPTLAPSVIPEAVPTPLLSAQEAQRRFAPSGTRIFTAPINEGVARLIGQAKAQELERESVLSRFSANHGILSDFGVGLAGFLLDPLNAASAFVPGIGEESVLGGLARVGVEVTGTAARIGARVAAGAVTGAAQQAPLSALRYAFGREEASDYSLRSAFSDIAMNAGVAAAFHAGFGTVRDLLRGRNEGALTPEDVDEGEALLDAGAAARHAAIRASVAQTVNGEAVDVGPVFDPDPDRVAEAAARQPGDLPPPGVTPEEWEEKPETIPLPEPTAPMTPAEAAVEGATLQPEPSERLEEDVTPYQPVPKPPQRLSSYLIRQGGLQNQGGEITAMLGDRRGRGRPGLYNRRGMTLDEAAHNAWEAGFLPGRERPGPNELLDALAEDLHGNFRFSRLLDGPEIEAYQAALAHNAEIDRLSAAHLIPIHGRTRAQFFDELYDVLSQGESAREIASQTEAHETALAEAERRAREWVAERGDAWEEADYQTGSAATLEELENEWRQTEASRGPQAGAGNALVAGPAGLGARADETGARLGGSGAGVAGRGGAAAGAGSAEDLKGAPAPAVERTEQGIQVIMPGAERSARQAMAAREAAGHGRIAPRAPQTEPGGLFAPLVPNERGLFDPHEIEQRIAAAEAAINQTNLLPEERAEIGQTETAEARAGELGEAYSAAGECLARGA